MTASARSAAPAVRDAATLILVRRDGGGPRVLMGQRGSGAAFMPSKFVFPGGAVDPADLALGATLALDPATARRLALHAAPGLAGGLALAAVRELWEETGLALARPDATAAAALERLAPGLHGLLARGLVPDASALRFVFRAVTPPGRPRRFDARFFVAEATGLHGDPDDFAHAGDELAHLQWIALDAARSLALPFITEVVLSEVAAMLGEPGPGTESARPVPFFHHDAAGSHVSLI